MNSAIRKFSIHLVVLLTCATFSASQTATQNAGTPKPEISDVLQYIHGSWRALQRSTTDCGSLIDTKLGKNTPSSLYLPSGMQVPSEVQKLQSECGVTLKSLPRKITGLGTVSPNEIATPGLLYLPNAYVVPGGRFNEMYGWDSYFIIRGLVADGERNLARGMVENFFFEIENYGAVLNANRTYYLTRSQPPFLTSMILAVYNADPEGKRDHAWLARAYGYAQRDYELWMKAPKLDASTGLSRYYDVGSGPVPEIGDHADYYVRVADWLVKHPDVHTDYLTTDAGKGMASPVRVPLCGSAPCEKSSEVWFTPGFFKGDRAMRESGFDISFRFGPFSGSTDQYAPVCLNSLLYKAESDLAVIAEQLGRKQEAAQWHEKAAHRKQLVARYLWSPKLGYFVDYNLTTRQQSPYLFASIFYPLWTGLATTEQAQSVMAHLSALEQSGGIAMSNFESGLQWDKPYGWAPIQLLAVEGMRRYGFNDDADRISRKFLTMVVENQRKDGTIREKYNVITRTTDAAVTAGYSSNVIGFGWTNGTFLSLLQALKPEQRQSLMLERASAAHQ